MSKSRSTGKVSTHCTTAKGGARKILPADPESLIGYAKLRKLRSCAASTQTDYLRYVRRVATRHGGDPSELTEAQVREHLLHLKEEHHYSPSSMRTAVSALSGYYNQHLGRAWKLFELVSSPSAQTLPQVLTREEVARLFRVVRTPRFRTVFRFIYSCGLRIGEAVQLEVGDLRIPGRVRIRLAKGNKDREVPLPPARLEELRAFWKTHRHPRFIFPGRGSRLARRRLGAGVARHRAGADGRGLDSDVHAPGGRGSAIAEGYRRAHPAPLCPADTPALRSGVERTKEIRIRMALGAQPRGLIWLFVRNGLILASIGAAIGLCISFALVTVLARILPALPSNNPSVVIGAAILLVAVALLACWLPARRTTRISPTVALRAE